MSCHICIVFTSAVLQHRQAKRPWDRRGDRGRDKRSGLQALHITHSGEWRTSAFIILLEFRPVIKHPYSEKYVEQLLKSHIFCCQLFLICFWWEQRRSDLIFLYSVDSMPFTKQGYSQMNYHRLHGEWLCEQKQPLLKSSIPFCLQKTENVAISTAR